MSRTGPGCIHSDMKEDMESFYCILKNSGIVKLEVRKKQKQNRS